MSLLKQNMIILVALSCLAIPRVGFAQAQLGPMDCKPLETQTFCFPGTILPPGGNENNPCSDCTFCRGPAKTMINSRIQCVEEECVRYDEAGKCLEGRCNREECFQNNVTCHDDVITMPPDVTCACPAPPAGYSACDSTQCGSDSPCP